MRRRVFVVSLGMSRAESFPSRLHEAAPSLEAPAAFFEARQVLGAVERVTERIAHLDHSALSREQQARGAVLGTRLARHLRMLALALSVSGGSYGVYRGMQAVAERMANVVQRVLVPLRGGDMGPSEEVPSAIPDAPFETAQGPAPTPLSSREMQGETVSDSTEEQAEQESEEVREQRLLREQTEADQANGRTLAADLWRDPAFLRLSSAEEMQRYAAAKVEEVCPSIHVEDPDAADQGPACNPFIVRETMQSELQTRARTAVERHERDPEQMLNVTRGMNRLTGTGLRNELDLAFLSGRGDLVRQALDSEVISGALTPSSHRGIEYVLGFSRGADDLDRLSRMYGDLTSEQQAALRERVLDQAGYFERRALGARERAERTRDGNARAFAEQAEAEHRLAEQARERMRIEFPPEEEDES